MIIVKMQTKFSVFKGLRLKLVKMSSKHFLTANNKLLGKKLDESQIETKIKARSENKSFVEYLLARMFF